MRHDLDAQAQEVRPGDGKRNVIMALFARQNRLMLPLGDRAPEEINVIVEIPSGSRNKYEYDKSMDIFRLDRALHSPVYYPGDYGFAPPALALDGDAPRAPTLAFGT